jgi:hypothetical protein
MGEIEDFREKGDCLVNEVSGSRKRASSTRRSIHLLSEA